MSMAAWEAHPALFGIAHPAGGHSWCQPSLPNIPMMMSAASARASSFTPSSWNARRCRYPAWNSRPTPACLILARPLARSKTSAALPGPRLIVGAWSGPRPPLRSGSWTQSGARPTRLRRQRRGLPLPSPRTAQRSHPPPGTSPTARTVPVSRRPPPSSGDGVLRSS